MKEELKTRVAKDGTMLGDPVPKSKYYRTFCWNCGEPMRTTMEAIYTPLYCEECSGGSTKEYIDLRDLHNYPQSENGTHFATDDMSSETFEQKVRMKF